MVKCYAASLGNCSDTQSREHCIPKALWSVPKINVEGFSWTHKNTEPLPVKNLASKILCTTHNSALSYLDAECQRLFQTVETFHAKQLARGNLPRSSLWKVDRADFEGTILERIFIKIAICIAQHEKDLRWAGTNSEAIDPPKEVINALFGKCPLVSPMGLYFAMSVGELVTNEESVRIQTIRHPNTECFVGAFIAIRDWQWLINLSDTEFSHYTARSMSGQQIGKDGTPPDYHLETVNFAAKGKLSGQINIDWDRVDH